MDWIFSHWAELALGALAFADLVVSLHPKWDGKKLGYIRAVVVALASANETRKVKANEVEKRGE